MHADICHTWLYFSSSMVTRRLKKAKELELLCFPCLKRDTCLYYLCAYHPFCYSCTLWSSGPWTDSMVLTQNIRDYSHNAFGMNLLFQLCIMPLICIFLVCLMSLNFFSIRRARFKFPAVHYSLFQFPTYLPIFLVFSCFILTAS